MPEIYLITNLENGKRYIGQTIMSTRRRWNKHKSNSRCNVNCSPVLEKAIKKYGEEKFTCETLLICSLEQLDFYETRFIEVYDSIVPNGYNLQAGGQASRNHHESTKDKFVSLRTGYKHSEETKKKIGDQHRGKIVGEETRHRIGATSRFRNISPGRRKVYEIFNCPMYLRPYYSKEKGIEGFIVKKPRYKQRKIIRQNLSLEEKFEIAKRYLSEISTVAGAEESPHSDDVLKV